MKRFTIILTSLFMTFSVCGSSFAQKKVTDFFIETPDSILPLLSRNNKLDLVDFITNNMDTPVKNLFGHFTSFEALNIPGGYLCIKSSDKNNFALKLLINQKEDGIADTTICIANTYFGPTPDTDVKFYDTNWHLLSRECPRPAVEEFFLPGLSEDTKMEFEILPLMKGVISQDSDTITWELQTGELSKEAKKNAPQFLKTITRTL